MSKSCMSKLYDIITMSSGSGGAMDYSFQLKATIVEYLQNHRDHSQEFPIPCKLFATVHLLPPSQAIVDSLVIGEWCSLLPVEKVVGYLKGRTPGN